MQIDPRIKEIDNALYRVAAKAVIIKDDKVLLVQDERDDDWTFPGGGVDIGESLEDAMIRELIEEIGVLKEDIETDFKIQKIIVGHIKEQIPRCNIHFKVNLLTDNIKATQETEKLEWVPITDLEKQKFDPSAGPKKEIIAFVQKLSISNT